MEEKEITKQLKALVAVKPNKHWVSLTKKTIFENETSSPVWFYIPLGRPAFALTSFALLATFALGGLVLFLPQRMPLKTYQNFQALISKFASQSQANEQAVASLQSIQAQLAEIDKALVGLKNIQNSSQALTMTEVIKETAKRSGQAVEDIKSSNGSLSRQVLASLSEVESASKSIEQKTLDIQKEMLASYLQDLQTRKLVGENADNLAKAQAYYKEGKISEAMIFITKIID